VTRIPGGALRLLSGIDSRNSLINGSAPYSYRGAAPVWEPSVEKILKISVYYSIDDFK